MPRLLAHKVLFLDITASELTVLLTSDPCGWSRRLPLFLTLLLAVICYSQFILGVSAIANAIGAALALVWFTWDLVDPLARGALARWASVPIGFVALLSLDPLNFLLLSLRSGRPIDLIIAVLFLMTGPMDHLITAIPQCACDRASTPAPGRINAPVLPAIPVVDTEGDEDDAEESAEPEVISGVLPVLGAQAEGEEVTALRGGCWTGPLGCLLVIVLAGVGAEVAIAAVVAAKGVIRFPEISQDSTGEKAEEFLIGSVSSWILVALMSIFIRVVSLY